MRYKTGFCFNAKELFSNWGSNLGIKSKMYYKKYHFKDLNEFLCAVFLYYMYFVLMDIIDNNVTFVLPLKGNREAMIHVKVFDEDEFQKAYSIGKFEGIDFLSSLFKGYQIFFRYKYGGGYREKPIYINNKIKSIFYDHINNGKVYY